MALGPAEVAHGPMLIGTILNVMLYGITITQIYLYYNSNRRDTLWIQGFIYLMFLADTVQTVFTVVYIYQSVIIHFGDVNYLATADWIFATDPALTGIIGGLVQAFYVRRLKVLTRNWIIVSVVLLCSLASILMGIATAAAISYVPHFVEFQKFKPVVIVWLVSAVFADLLITSSLVGYLNKQRTGFAKTNGYIDKIVRLTVQTGLLTAVWALVDLIVYLADPTGRHLIFNFPLSKLYTNSLMSSLNARDFWKYGSNSESTSEGIMSTGNITLNTLPPNRDHSTQIFVQVESHAQADHPSKLDLDDHQDAYEKEVDAKANLERV